MLKIKNLSKSFGANCIINQLNLNVSKGELIYIHGNNGCGKSTLFKIISGIIDTDSGSIKIDDDVTIGALIENPGFIENETLKFNLDFLASLNMNYNEKYIVQLCENFNLNYYSKTKLKSYSVGMRQKVGIIQSIMENQNLILLDEPTRGLDDDAINVLKVIIKEFIKSNKTIIIASHDKIVDLSFDKTYLMKNGTLIQE